MALDGRIAPIPAWLPPRARAPSANALRRVVVYLPLMMNSLGQMLSQRLPIVCLPAALEVLLLRRRKTGMVKDEPGLGALLLELESGDRVDAILPRLGAPCLDDPLIGRQLDIAPHHHSSKAGKGTTRFGADLGWSPTAHRAELLSDSERFIDALGAGLKNNFLMDARHG